MKGDAKREKCVHIHIYIGIILLPMEHYREFLITLPAQRNSCREAAEGSKHPVLHPHLLINGWDFTYFTSLCALLLAYVDSMHSKLRRGGASDSSGRGSHGFYTLGCIRLSKFFQFQVRKSEVVFLTSKLNNAHN